MKNSVTNHKVVRTCFDRDVLFWGDVLGQTSTLLGNPIDEPLVHPMAHPQAEEAGRCSRFGNLLATLVIDKPEHSGTEEKLDKEYWS